MSNKYILSNELFNLLEQRWVSSSDIEKITQLMKIDEEDIHIKIFILNQVMELIRIIPDSYFKEESHRQNILESTQDVLDEFIEIEESEGEDEEIDDDLDFEF